MAKDKIDSRLLQEMRTVLAMNDHGKHTIPAEDLYPHQWLWDSCFIAIGLRNINIERAQEELVSLLKGQWHNGMLPHMIFNSGVFYRQDRELWRSTISYYAPNDIATSGITQPPVLAEAVVQIGKKLSKADRLLWYKKMYKPLLRHHKWLYNDRDPNKTGLVLNIHPWETGMDDTPPWMHSIHKIQLPLWVSLVKVFRIDKLINRLRRDTRFVTATQRPSTIDALALLSVMQRVRRLQYKTQRVLDKGLLAIEDVTFNSIFIKSNLCLKEIAKTINVELPQQLLSRMQKSEQALEQLWNKADQTYYNRNFYNQQVIKIESVGTLLPLYSGAISKDRAEQLVEKYKDAASFKTKYPAPSVPKNSDYFDEYRFWQGPTWVNINWFIIQGLEQYGYKKEAAELRSSTIEMVRKSGSFEYFSPNDAKPAGAKNFSWTAALVIDLLNNK